MIPLGWTSAIGSALGPLLAAALPGKRRIARRNLDLIYGPGMPDGAKRRIIRRMFGLMGRHAIEFMQIGAFARRRGMGWIRLEGGEHLARALADGKGAIVAAGHTGNWDLTALAGPRFASRVNFVTRRLRNPSLDEFWRIQRTSIGSDVVDAKSPREILRRLRANEIVILVVDQNRRAAEGVFLDFLGIPACTTDTPARLALRFGVPMLTAWARMEPQGRHRLVIEPEVPVPAGADEETALRRMMEEVLRRLERVIRECPEQWIWMHRRWRTRPPGEPPIY